MHESQGRRRERTRRARGGKRGEKEKQTRGTRTGTSGEAKHPDWNIRGAEARDWSVPGSSGLGLERPGLRKEGDTVAENNGEEHMNKGKGQMRKERQKRVRKREGKQQMEKRPNTWNPEENNQRSSAPGLEHRRARRPWMGASGAPGGG